VRESVSVKFRRDPAERFRPERYFGERWIPEREREIFRRNPAEIPSREGLLAAGERDLPVKKTKRERGVEGEARLDSKERNKKIKN
jgi:hypothetical protein